MSMIATVAGAALLVLGLAAPQPAPDMFSCVEASRLTAGTLTYTGPAGGPITHATDLLRDGNKNVIRMTWKASASTEQVTTLDAASLVPFHFRMRLRLDTPEPLLFGELTIIDGEIRGFPYPSAPRLALPTNGEPAIFGTGGYLLPLLARAVNWERCPSVSARYLDQDKLVTATLKRTGSTTISYQGVPVNVFEIDVARAAGAGKIWVTQTAPYVTMKFTGISDSVFTLIARQAP